MNNPAAPDINYSHPPGADYATAFKFCCRHEVSPGVYKGKVAISRCQEFPEQKESTESILEVIDTARAESFFHFSVGCANANKQTSTSSEGDTYQTCHSALSLKIQLSSKQTKILGVWHTIIKAKKKAKPKAIYRKGFVCLAGIYIYIYYISSGKKTEPSLICKSHWDAVSLLIENHRES